MNQQIKVKAYIGLGSNIGNREQYLTQAISRLKKHESIESIKCSSIYETAPLDFLEQDAFLNMVLELQTSLQPLELLELLQLVERDLGRVREFKNGPRTIDLDLLLYGQERVQLPDLVIPHPRMLDRLFVLIPFTELYNGDEIPGCESLSERLNKLDGREGVVQWKTM